MPASPSYDPARLKSLVVASGRSYREIEADSGVGLRNLTGIFSGENVPKASTLAKILAAIGANWSDLDRANAGPPE